MAKRSKLNKSQRIRDALAANPRKTPSEISEILKGEGLVVKPQYVSTIKSNAKKARRRRTRTLTVAGAARRTRRSVAGSAGSYEGITAAVEFVKSAGGLAQARAALATLEEIGSLVR